MNNRLRRVLFWLHLAAGVAAGLVVAVMSLTGAALAFDAQIRGYAERESRQVDPPADGARLPIDELMRRAEVARPGTPITAVLVPADPREAVRVSLGRDDGLHVNPYTGEVRPLAGATTRQVLGVLIRWHRYLGAGGEGRALGQAITGASNAAFFFLALSGLYLWWPRRWSLRAMRGTLWFRRGLGGRARDFNWHNVIGFWSLPVLIVITFSGLMISYKPVSNLIYAAVGEKPPAGGPGAAPVAVPPPAPGASRVPLESLLAVARAQVPGWTSLVVRPAGAAGRADGPARGRAAAAQATAVTVKAPDAGPPFASITLAFDPFTGKLLKEERLSDQTTGRRIRSWLRFLHTGEALGVPGQLIAGVVSLGALVLVYSGFAMALRRLAEWSRRRRAAVVPVSFESPDVRGSLPRGTLRHDPES